MSIQYPFFRALRCAGVALSVAAGLEGLRHVAVAGLSSWQAHTAAVLSCACVIFVLTFSLFFGKKAPSNPLKDEANLRAEAQLKLQSAALEAADNAILIADHEGLILWVNRAFTAMTGYGHEEALGKNLRQLMFGEQTEVFFARLWSTISSGKVWKGEIVNQRKDGSTYPQEMTITPVTQDFGNPATHVYFIAINQDITERKQIEQALRQAEEKYRAMFQDAVVGMFQSTPDGRYSNVNPAMAHMLGYGSPQELIASVTDIARSSLCRSQRVGKN